MIKDIHKEFLEKIKELEYKFYSTEIYQYKYCLPINEICGFEDSIKKYKIIKRLEFFMDFLDFMNENFNEIYSLKMDKNPFSFLLKIFELKLELFLKTIHNFPYFCFDNEKKQLDIFTYKIIDFQKKIQKRKEEKQLFYLSIFYKGGKINIINQRDITEMIYQYLYKN